MNIKRTIDFYKDIIDLPHHQSKKYPHMSMMDRAAQFAPFAALTGHAEGIKESARLTDSRVELSEDENINLDIKFHYVMEHIDDRTEFEFVYFVPDSKKTGGKYVKYKDSIHKIDIYNGIITFTHKHKININDIIDINFV